MRKKMRFDINTLFALFAACIMMPPALPAASDTLPKIQESVSPEKLSDGNADSGDAYMLDEFVVTAYRVETQPLDTPVNSTYIGPQKIADSPYTNVAEVIKNYGNLNFRTVTGSPSTGDFGMRGFGENSQTRILVLVDGQKINRADMGAINWLQIPLSQVESVEILRGSQSALYGSSAEAGVIKITTTKPKEDGLHFSAQGIYGSFSTYDASARVTGREGDYFFTANASYFDSEGWRENSESWATSAALSVGCDLDSKNTFVLTGNYTDSHTNYPDKLTWEQYQEDPRKSYSDGIYAYSKDGIYTATLKNNSDIGQGELPIGWNFRDIFWTLGGRSREFQWTGTATPRYNFSVGENAHILVGFDGEWDYIDYKKYYQNTSATFSFADINKYSCAPYLGGDWAPLEWLSFNLVGRVEASKLTVDNTEYLGDSIPPMIDFPLPGGGIVQIPNPNYQNPPAINAANSYDSSMSDCGFAMNFATNVKVSEEASLFFRFDRIYHYPTTDEVAAYHGGGLAQNFNFNLNPEEGENYEIGGKWISRGWSATSSFYLTYLRNEICYDANSQMNVNLSPTQRIGCDLELAYDTKYWGASAMFSAVQARFDGGVYDGKDVPLAPNYYGNVCAYVSPFEWVRLSGRVTFISSQYVGSDFSNSGSRIPAYALLDFQANFRFCDYGSIFLAIENALDKKYISCAYGTGYYPGTGRMLKAGVTIRF